MVSDSGVRQGQDNGALQGIGSLVGYLVGYIGPEGEHMGKRIKVSLTLDEGVVAAVDQAAARGELPNRSQVVEAAIRLWIRERKRVQLDHEIEAYYKGMTDEERAEDAEWAALGDEAIRDIWDD